MSCKANVKSHVSIGWIRKKKSVDVGINNSLSGNYIFKKYFLLDNLFVELDLMIKFQVINCLVEWNVY